VSYEANTSSDNAPGSLAGTLGAVSNPLGPYVPVLFVSQSDGLALLANITTPLIADILVNAVQENRTTYNVVAQTKGGDPNSVVALGAHSDSVNAGPGINDDGSGSIGILSVAKALTKFSLTNAVRFHWWTAEEYGLLGSEFYVASLNKTETDKIALYLNFDMIASPNYIYAIYDGDGSAFNLSGPAGSAQIEGLFEDYFTSQGLPSVPTEFNGRSDYGPFLDVGIPSGGLFTGAEANKTVAQAALFGGTAGVALDECYHAACDDIDNLALDAFLVNTKAIAHSIATYATDLSSIPRNTTAAVTKRQIRKRAPKSEHHVHSCSHEIVLHEL
jgi:carboxypeptidase Q